MISVVVCGGLRRWRRIRRRRRRWRRGLTDRQLQRENFLLLLNDDLLSVATDPIFLL
jgi:hypothetical protein